MSIFRIINQIVLYILIFIISFNEFYASPLNKSSQKRKSIDIISTNSNLFGRKIYKYTYKAIIKLPYSEGEQSVSEEYYNKILETSRFQAITESFYLLSSGREYQWIPIEDKSYEDIITFFIKASLLLTTGYYYIAAQKANSDINDSFLGFGSDQAISKFQNQYNNFKIASTATALVFTASAVHAYIRFGRDSDYKNLHISHSTHFKDTYLRTSFLDLGIRYHF